MNMKFFIVIAASTLLGSLPVGAVLKPIQYKSFPQADTRVFDPLDNQTYYVVGGTAYNSTANPTVTFMDRTVNGNMGCYVIKYNINGTAIWVNMAAAISSTACSFNNVGFHPNGRVMWVLGSTRGSIADQPAAPAGTAANVIWQLERSTGAFNWAKTVSYLSHAGTNVSSMRLAPVFDVDRNCLYVVNTGSAFLGFTASRLAVSRLTFTSSTVNNLAPTLDWNVTLNTAVGQASRLLVTTGSRRKVILSLTDMQSNLMIISLDENDGSLENMYGTADSTKLPIYDKQSDVVYLWGVSNGASFNGVSKTGIGYDVFVTCRPAADIVAARWTLFFGSTGNDSVTSLLIHPLTGDIYVVGTVRGYVGELPDQVYSGNDDLFVAQINPNSGKLSIKVYGTIFGESASNAYFDPDGRLVVEGRWADLWAVMVDSETIPGQPTTTITPNPQSPTSDPSPSSSPPTDFITSLFTVSSHRAAFFISFCIIGVLVVLLLVLSVFRYRGLRNGEGGDGNTGKLLKNRSLSRPLFHDTL